MRRSIPATLIVLLSLSVLSFAKDKKKQVLPDVVLNAKSVIVLIDSEAGMSVTNPNENRSARLAVEHALQKWGRFRVMWNYAPSDPPDLIIVVRKGSPGTRPVIIGGPTQEPRTGIDTTDIGSTIGVSRRGQDTNEKPRFGTEYSSAEDMFSVHLHSDKNAPIWRYSGKHALDEPGVRAVEEFKKAITESEEARKQKNP